MDELPLIANLQIYDADSYGRGVGKHEGKIIFVPYAAPGDIVDCRVVSWKPKYDTAVLERVVEPGRHRISPPCPYFTGCPGCAYQHIDYGLELELKGKRITACLEKIGRARVGEVEVSPSPDIYGYRSHVTLHLWYNGLETWCGLIDPLQRRVYHLDECLLLPEFARDLPGRVRNMVADLIGSYRGRFALRLPFIIDHIGERLMLVPGRSPMKKIRRMMRVVLDALQEAYPAADELQRQIAGRTFRFNTLSFTQANEALMPLLYEKARRAVADKLNGRLLDLFSGVGVLGIICAGNDGATFVEMSPAAVDDIKHNATINGINDATVIEGRVEDVLGKLIADGEYACALMNPPRRGLPPEVPEILRWSDIDNLVYVSCNPSTLGRDVRRFAEGGFAVVSAEGVDMFPRTPHVESVVVMRR